MLTKNFSKKIGKKVAKVHDDILMHQEEPLRSPSVIYKFKDLSPRAAKIDELRKQKKKQKKMEFLERMVNEEKNVDLNVSNDDNEYEEFAQKILKNQRNSVSQAVAIKNWDNYTTDNRGNLI